jgi:hypothetical protein
MRDDEISWDDPDYGLASIHVVFAFWPFCWRLRWEKAPGDLLVVVGPFTVSFGWPCRRV